MFRQIFDVFEDLSLGDAVRCRAVVRCSKARQTRTGCASWVASGTALRGQRGRHRRDDAHAGYAGYAPVLKLLKWSKHFGVFCVFTIFHLRSLSYQCHFCLIFHHQCHPPTSDVRRSDDARSCAQIITPAMTCLLQLPRPTMKARSLGMRSWWRGSAQFQYVSIVSRCFMMFLESIIWRFWFLALLNAFDGFGF